MKRWIAAGTAVVLGFGLAGCTPEPAPPVEVTPWPPQTSSPAPTAYSDEELLTIGVETYEAMLIATGETLDRGFDDGTLAGLSTSELQGNVDQVVSRAETSNLEVIGIPTIENAIALEVAQSNGVASIRFSACVDSSNVQVNREDGTSDLPVDFNPRHGAVITVDNSEGSFRVSALTSPEEGDPCAP